jgi:Uma2 family endonuclease
MVTRETGSAPQTDAPFDVRMYPVSERKTMPSDQHGRAILLLYLILQALLPDDVYVAFEVAVLYDRRNLRKHRTPDLFIAFGVGQNDPMTGKLRRQYRVWHEGKPPEVVVELSSESTVGDDLTDKLRKYTAMGVREYVLYDPLGEWLKPRLQVYLLQDAGAPQVAAQPDGSVLSPTLGLVWVEVDHKWLRLRDPLTGALILTREEQNEAERAMEAERAREAERRAQALEAARATEAERAQALEEEVRRLQAELEQLRETDSARGEA